MVYSERIFLIISKGIYADLPFIVFFIARVTTEAIPDDIIDDAIYTAGIRQRRRDKQDQKGKLQYISPPNEKSGSMDFSTEPDRKPITSINLLRCLPLILGQRTSGKE